MAPLLGNDRRRIELLHGLLFSLPGTPVLYYGDEIGMGDNIHLGDRNGVRTPMQWSADRNAGFSRANPQQLYLPVIADPEYHFTAVNVENQQRNPHSLLWWIKRLLALRESTRAFGHGSFEFLLPDNRKALAYLRRHGEDTILVVANLSRFSQPVEIDLSPFQGALPVEMFGHTAFPRIGAAPYVLTLSPHAFHWFRLQPPDASPAPPPPAWLDVSSGLQVLATGTGREQLERVLPAWIARRPWFSARENQLLDTQVAGIVPLETSHGTPGVLVVARAEMREGEADVLALPLGASFGQEARRRRARGRAVPPHRRHGRGRAARRPALGAPAGAAGRGLCPPPPLARGRHRAAGLPRWRGSKVPPDAPATFTTRMAAQRCGSRTGCASCGSIAWSRGRDPSSRCAASSPSAGAFPSRHAPWASCRSRARCASLPTAPSWCATSPTWRGRVRWRSTTWRAISIERRPRSRPRPPPWRTWPAPGSDWRAAWVR